MSLLPWHFLPKQFLINGCLSLISEDNRPKMKLSIVIPAHNEEDGIARTIEDVVSLLENDKIAHEIVLVNDNSTDGTSRVAGNLASKYAQVKIVNRARRADSAGPSETDWTRPQAMP